MKYDLYVVYLLTAIEAYIPYMTEEELKGVILYGEMPGPVSFWSWSRQKQSRDEELRAKVEEALKRQKRG